MKKWFKYFAGALIVVSIFLGLFIGWIFLMKFNWILGLGSIIVFFCASYASDMAGR